MRWAYLGFLLSTFPLNVMAVTFTPHELFHVPFGSGRDALGSSVKDGNFLFPRDFTMDELGHFYIYDSERHRIVRFSDEGKFEMDFRYLSTATQVFAHPDAHQNLWLLITDPAQGLYYGVYDSKGKLLRSGVFSKYNHFRLHVDDSGGLHVILSSDQDPKATQTYIFDEQRLLMKKDPVAPPPENHHQIRKSEHTYFIDAVPNASKDDAGHVNRVTDESHHGVADIKGSVIYVTSEGEVYTRVGECEINVYDVDGSLKTSAHLTGLPSACATLRFDTDGTIYELDGTPPYIPSMRGMRLIQWRRE